MTNLKNKNVLITGGTLGLGYELAKYFISKKANVIICSSKKKNLINAYKKLDANLGDNQQLLAFQANLSKENDIINLYRKISKKFKKLDILISNAGVYGPKGPLVETNWKSWKKGFEINFYGSVFLIKTFTKLVSKSKKGKIIQLSGGGATAPMPFLSSYAASKAAIVRFIETISFELLNYNIDINCIAPGALNTRLLDEIIKAGPSKIGKKFYEKSLNQRSNGGSGFENAINLCEFLCSSKSNGITGKLISAQWDNYEKISKNKKLINKSDVFTLRRIIGKDRKLPFLDK